MKPLTWDEYWDGFFGWSESTQKSYVSRLSSFGSVDEVFDAINEFMGYDEKFAARFTEKALDAGVRFTPEQIYEMEGSLPESILKRMEQTAVDPFEGNTVPWNEFYSRFYDVPDSTKLNLSQRLGSFGLADEVFEIFLELSYEDEATASDFAQRAAEMGVRFTPEQVLEMVGDIDEAALSFIAPLSSKSFTREQLDEIYGSVSDDAFEQLSKRAGIDIFEEEAEENAAQDEPLYVDEPAPKLGFFAKLFYAIGVAGELGHNEKGKHPDRCNGDCAHCPPHYGYRYGRWYYGHHHQHGCEFGGNKGL